MYIICTGIIYCRSFRSSIYHLDRLHHLGPLHHLHYLQMDRLDNLDPNLL